MHENIQIENQIGWVSSFTQLVETPFKGNINAICWNRTLKGNFAEIVEKFQFQGTIKEVTKKQLLKLKLSDEGEKARTLIINDWELLENHGSMPVLNIINQYERDDSFPFFPTDVYSYHVDRSPIPSDTILCTYYGDASEIIPNAKAQQKILIPEVRAELRKLYAGDEKGFENFLKDHFFDLHYESKANSEPLNLGVGNLWRLAIDHPKSNVLPCIHRAPIEQSGKRLLMIC